MRVTRAMATATKRAMKTAAKAMVTATKRDFVTCNVAANAIACVVAVSIAFVSVG
jgi:hypothetical protein